MTEHANSPRLTRPPHFTTVLDPAGVQYSDIDGVRWRVREMRRSNHAPALYFESDIAFRRVTEYPRDWRELDGDELEVLSHGR